MEISKTVDGSVLNLAVSGEINSGNADQLVDALSDLEGIDHIDLDLGQLSFISSAGLRALLIAEREMKAKSGEMIVCNVQDDVMDIFDISGFSKILTIE